MPRSEDNPIIRLAAERDAALSAQQSAEMELERMRQVVEAARLVIANKMPCTDPSIVSLAAALRALDAASEGEKTPPAVLHSPAYPAAPQSGEELGQLCRHCNEAADSHSPLGFCDSSGSPTTRYEPAPPKTEGDVEIVKHGTWRHYKGGLYTVFGTATHHDTRQPMVLYVSHEKGCTNCRPVHGWPGDPDGFLDNAEVDGRSVARFEYLAPPKTEGGEGAEVTWEDRAIELEKQNADLRERFAAAEAKNAELTQDRDFFKSVCCGEFDEDEPPGPRWDDGGLAAVALSMWKKFHRANSELSALRTANAALESENQRLRAREANVAGRQRRACCEEVGAYVDSQDDGTLIDMVNWTEVVRRTPLVTDTDEPPAAGKSEKCRHCGKARGERQTNAPHFCPYGSIGYCSNTVFTPSDSPPSEPRCVNRVGQGKDLQHPAVVMANEAIRRENERIRVLEETVEAQLENIKLLREQIEVLKRLTEKL